MSTPAGVSAKEFNFVSQLSHFGWGLAVTLVGCRLGHEFVAAGLWIAYAAIKEFWYDQRYEAPEVRGSSLEDFIFQFVGAIAGVIFVLITKR